LSWERILIFENDGEGRGGSRGILPDWLWQRRGWGSRGGLRKNAGKQGKEGTSLGVMGGEKTFGLEAKAKKGGKF